MSNGDVVKTIALKVTAKNDIAGGMRDVRVGFIKSLEDLEREAYKKKISLKGRLEGLSKTVGESSDLKKTLDVLKGAGAVAGISMATIAAERLSSGVRTVAIELATGNKSAAELTEEFTAEIPIVGSVYTTLKNIGDVVTGTSVAQARANHAMEIANAQATILLNTHRDTLAAVRQINAEREKHQENVHAIQFDQRKAKLASIGFTDAFPSAAERLELERKVREYQKQISERDEKGKFTRNEINAYRVDAEHKAERQKLLDEIRLQRVNLPPQQIYVKRERESSFGLMSEELEDNPDFARASKARPRFPGDRRSCWRTRATSRPSSPAASTAFSAAATQRPW